MTEYYELGRIEECLPTIYAKETHNDELLEPPRILHLEFYKELRIAIMLGDIHLFSSAGRLLSPKELGTGLEIYLSEEKVNSWLKKEQLPYHWRPEKTRTKPVTLLELKADGRLQQECLTVIKNLKNRGIPIEGLQKRKVAIELQARLLCKRFKINTLEQRIRASWWRR